MPLEDWLPSTPPGPPSYFVCSSTEHATMDHPQPSLESIWERVRKCPPAVYRPFIEYVSPEEYERRRRER